ncbi:MAG: phospho-sugar mutase [Erysipelotrichaceae bacterium]
MYQVKYTKWLDQPDLPKELREQLLSMDEKLKEDCFYTNLEFGTAGMRGLLGVGTNRMNIYTIRKANEGFARYIEKNEGAKEKGIAIGYDNRFMSKEFALESARLLASHNIKSYLFESLRPTPEVSFATRELGCFGGIMITASHNPKEYNGYKLYDDKGCQLIPSIVCHVIDEINQIDDELNIKYNLTADQEKLINMLSTDFDEIYFAKVMGVQLQPNLEKVVKIIFTPQHGTASVGVRTIFDRTGYNYISVKEQEYPDPAFSNTITPNPEEKDAYILAMDYARKYDADICLTTDPDGDRVGVVVKHQGDFHLVSGNQTGAIQIDYLCNILKQQNKLPSNGAVFNTVVTSDLGEKVANSYGIEVEKTLTGFKFIGEKVAKYEINHLKEYVFGYEESYGSLISPFVRDKDALQACLSIAEIANYYKLQGKTLIDVLNDLYVKFGYYHDAQSSITLPGVDGLTKLKAILSDLRANPLTNIAGVDVIAYEDYGTLKRIENGTQSDLVGYSKSDVLKYYLKDGGFVAVRPSGTEPKCKIYYCICDKNEELTMNKFQKIKEFMLNLTKK